MTNMPVPSPSPSEQAPRPDLGRFFSYRIWVLSRLLALEGGRIYMGQFNLTLPQWRVLSTLGHFGEMSVTSIAEHIFMDRGQTSRTIDALIERGLVRMRPNIEDRRSTLFSLSPEGERRYAEALPVAGERQRKLLEEFSAEEVEAFSRMIDRLIERVSRSNSAD